MEAKKSYEIKQNNFEFAIDRIYDVALLFLLCTITSHNSMVEGTNYIYYAAFFLFIGVAAFRAIVRSNLSLRHFSIPVQTFWYGIFIIVCVSSVLWAKYPDSVMEMISRMVQNLALSYLIILNVETKIDFRRVQNIFILSVVYMAFKILFSVPASQLFSRHLGNYDITGHNVNFTAFYFAITLMILFHRFYTEKRLSMIALFLFLTFMLLLTSSRKAVLMLILGIFLMIFFDRTRKHRFLKLFVAVVVLAVFIYIIFTNDNLYRAIGWKFDSMLNFLENKTGDNSLYERKFFREYALELFYRNPVLGVGLNNFSKYLGNVFTRSTYSHNNWLEMLSCLGILGFAAYYWFYGYLIVKLQSQQKKGVGYVSLFLVIMLCIFFSEYAMIVYFDTFIQLIITLCFIGVSVADRDLKSIRSTDFGGNSIG